MLVVKAIKPAIVSLSTSTNQKLCAKFSYISITSMMNMNLE